MVYDRSEVSVDPVACPVSGTDWVTRETRRPRPTGQGACYVNVRRLPTVPSALDSESQALKILPYRLPESAVTCPAFINPFVIFRLEMEAIASAGRPSHSITCGLGADLQFLVGGFRSPGISH
ncbi:hypothetical protein J6590_048631 [Homalodisca vitripennis]|nr:hypothetical protein J6590_048631 [Homalodisca vitripennis]